jgi:hypothetical protein
MRRTLTASLTALLAATALAPVASAMAADAPTTVPSLHIVKAYAYVDDGLGDGKTYASVVFKTKGELPRRYDGMIRAGAALDGTSHSVGSVRGAHGTRAHCYVINVEIRDGKIRGPKGKRAKIGSRHTLVVTARGSAGTDLSDTTTVTLHHRQTGDRSGAPLGC